MENQPRDVHISGSGSIDAGSYGEIGISGSGTGKGDISCSRLRVSGSGRFAGSIACEGQLRVSGSASVEGALSAGEARISGSMNVSGPVRAKELHVSGSLKAAADVEADEAHISGGGKLAGVLRGGTVRLSGSLSVEKGVECEELMMSGAFTANGLMNAERVQIRVGGRCRADEIGGESIDVRRDDFPVGGLGALFAAFGQERCLEANAIEGTSVYLECTRAAVVRGARVEIGPDCQIGRVEYGESLTVDPSSRVEESAKSERPVS